MAAIKKGVFLFLLTAYSLLLTANVEAEDYAAIQGYIHSFNNNVSVYSGVFALNKDINLDTSAYFKYTIDMINPDFGEGGKYGGANGEDGEDDDYVSNNVAATSGASSSSSSSSGGTVSDTRNEITLGLTHNFSNIIGIDIYYDYSKEKDYTSNTPSISLKRDLFEKNTTLTMGYSKSMDDVYGQFMTEHKTKDSNNYFAGITQVISPVTVLQVGYYIGDVKGNTSEGIRLVPIDGATQSSCTAISTTCVNEVFPDNRLRNAYVFGINHYFAGGFMDRSAIKLNSRYYNDDWGIKSRTKEIEYYKYLSDKTILRLNVRYYEQTKTDFVKDAYTTSDMYKSSSQQLLAFNSQLAGIKLTHTFEKNSFVEGKYEFYTQSIGINAHIFMIGLRYIF